MALEASFADGSITSKALEKLETDIMDLQTKLGQLDHLFSNLLMPHYSIAEVLWRNNEISTYPISAKDY